MAEVLVTIVLDQLSNFIAEKVKVQVQELRMLKMIREPLDDAEKRRVNDKNVKHRLEVLEVFSYDADNVLDVKLEEIVREKDRFNFLVTATGAVVSDQDVFRRVMTTGVVDESEVHGRDFDKDVTIRKLLESSDQENGSLVVSVAGTGGIGKTTLAQLAYGDKKLKDHFDERIWVCVSDPFDEVKIAEAILEVLTKSSPNLSQFSYVVRKIQECVSKKRFFLMLTMYGLKIILNGNRWKNSLKNGAPGNRILVTSRSERVVGMTDSSYMHRLEPISDSDCWSLFSRIAFSGRTNEDRENLEDIGRRTVRKCKGLPLAAKTLGSLLRFKVTEQEWRTVLDNQTWKLEEVAIDLFPHLYLSYDDLPPILKRCFSYCAIFPKDTIINVNRLIRIWMAQVYLSTVENNQQEAKGCEYFMNLAMRSSFHELEADDKNINFLSINDCYRIMGSEETKNIELFLRIYHLCWERTDTIITPVSVCDVGKIRSLFAEHLLSKDLTRNLFKGLKCPRLLNLCGSGMQELPEEVGNLFHLRYIDLSGNLQGFMCLSRLPQYIRKLISLRQLITTDTPKHITELRLNFYWASQVRMSVMEALIPPPDLKILTLSECFSCTFLPSLGKFPFLEILWIRLMDELKHVGNEFLGLPGTIKAFPKLKNLRFSHCSEWEEWTDLKPEVGILVMLNLKELELNFCEKLKSLPYYLLQRVSSLESLKVKMCSCLEPHWTEITHIQNIEIDNGM
ncbi:unnamed protein product [Withania somnifera]